MQAGIKEREEYDGMQCMDEGGKEDSSLSLSFSLVLLSHHRSISLCMERHIQGERKDVHA